MQLYPVGHQHRDFQGLTLLAVRVAPRSKHSHCRADAVCSHAVLIALLCRAQPAVTIGNVGQLAVDLLISTAQLPLVGYLESRHVLPCFGLDAFTAGGGPATALELYLDAARGVLVLQQRAPAVTGCQRRFAEELLDWVQQAGLRKVGA